MKFLALFSLAAIATAAPLPCNDQQGNGSVIQSNGRSGQSPIAGAAFFMTNDPTGNMLVVNAIHRTGKVSLSKIIPTGGNGLHGNAGGNMTGPDGLFSQGSVVAGDGMVFAVNPGSNTVSQFVMNNPNTPLDLKMVSQVNSGGEFPMSLAYSSAKKMLCVLNGGAKNGVSCFNSQMKMVSQQPLGLNQTTPPTGPANTASDILFNQDSSAVMVSVKGDPKAAPGFVASFPLDQNNQLSAQPIKTTPNGGVLPFSMTLIPGTNALLATDAGVGVDVFNFANGANQAGSTSVTPIQGQGATCWSDFSKRTNTFFTSDIMTSKITEVAVDKQSMTAAIVKQYPMGVTDNTIDLAVGAQQKNDFLYVNAAGSQHINVMALNKEGAATMLQTFDVGKAAAAKGVQLTSSMQGMATSMVQ